MKRSIALLTLLFLPLATSHAATNAPTPAKATAAEGYADPGIGTREEKKTSGVTDPAILNLSLEPPVVNTSPGPEYQDENREFAGAFYGIDRTPGGRLWAGWASGGDSEKGFMLLASSDDDGKTWPAKLLLDERRTISYPDIAQAPNGDIYVHYDRNRYSDAEILFARFREEDVRAGKLVSKDAALKNLVKSKLGMNHGSSRK